MYVPFTHPIAGEMARRLAVALWRPAPRAWACSPNLNLTNGLIRLLGSRHRSAGSQVLHGSLDAAVRLAQVGNPLAVWERLMKALAAEFAATAPGDPCTPAPVAGSSSLKGTD